jgi:transposase
VLEAQSSCLRAAPSTGVLGSNGISRGDLPPRIHKQEQGHRRRGFRRSARKAEAKVRYAGIDIGSQEHMVAVVDATGELLVKATAVGELKQGYERLAEVLGTPEDLLVVMEATGHYWQNLFGHLTERGYSVAVVNALRTRRYAEEELARTKTDAIDARGLARFGAEKKPPATVLPDAATLELRELVRMRDRLVQEHADKARQLHRLVDLGFPELKGLIKELDGTVGLTLLSEYPTAAAYERTTPARIAKLEAGGRKIGRQLAEAVFAAATQSVGRHHGHAYELQVRYLCDDLRVLKRRIGDIERDIARVLENHDVGKLLTTIPGVGPQTSARIIAEVGDPTQFASPATLAAFIGLVPSLRQSGKKRSQRAHLTAFGHARLRKGLWMPTLVAVRCNPWLRATYQRLRARGKPAKVALVACMRKLVGAIYSVAKNRRPFIPMLPNPVEVGS